MKMSVLLLLVTAIGMLVPSEAQAKRYRVDRTGRNSWTVTDEAELLDDPDRFAFGADPELLRKWGIDPEEVCKTPPGRSTGLGREDSSTLPTSEGRCPRTILEERSDTWKEGGDPLQPDSCRWINNTWQSFNLTDLRRQLADRIKSGRDPGCDSMVGMVEALEHVAPPSNPVLQKKRADLENCLESRRRSLAAKIKEIARDHDLPIMAGQGGGLRGGQAQFRRKDRGREQKMRGQSSGQDGKGAQDRGRQREVQDRPRGPNTGTHRNGTYSPHCRDT